MTTNQFKISSQTKEPGSFITRLVSVLHPMLSTILVWRNEQLSTISSRTKANTESWIIPRISLAVWCYCGHGHSPSHTSMIRKFLRISPRNHILKIITSSLNLFMCEKQNWNSTKELHFFEGDLVIEWFEYLSWNGLSSLRLNKHLIALYIVSHMWNVRNPIK